VEIIGCLVCCFYVRTSIYIFCVVMISLIFISQTRNVIFLLSVDAVVFRNFGCAHVWAILFVLLPTDS
jgi:hypothetical protein